MALPKVILLDGVHSTLQIPAPADAPVNGDILKLADNRVGIITGLNLADVKSGDPIAVVVSGPVRFTKGSSKVFTAGTRPYWDVSGNVPLPVGDGSLANGDPVLGNVIVTAGSGKLSVDIDLNAPAGAVYAA